MDFLEPVAFMSESVLYAGLAGNVPQTSVQPDRLSNYDLFRCQTGLRPERTAFAELLRRYQSTLIGFIPPSS